MKQEEILGKKTDPNEDLGSRRKVRPKSQEKFNFFNDKNDLGYLLRSTLNEVRPMNINDFLGFNLETRIRNMVADCIEPLKMYHDSTVKRVFRNEEKAKVNAKLITDVQYILSKTV